MKFYNTIPEEQETITNIDYFSRNLHIYTSRKSVMQRLISKLGAPTSTNTVGGAITGASWTIPFADKKKLSIALSKPLLIGQMK